MVRRKDRPEKPVWPKLVEAAWKGAVEAGKVIPIAAFSLGFLEHLREEFPKMRREKRAEVARALRRARFEDIEAELDFLQEEYRGLRRELAETILGFFRVLDDHEGRLLTLEEIKDQIPLAIERLRSEMHEEFDAFRTDFPDMIADERREHLDEETARFERQYLEEVKGQHGFLEILGIPNQPEHLYSIDVAFVSLSLSSSTGQYREMSAEEFMKEPRLTIQGMAGSGKTTLLKWLACRCGVGEKFVVWDPHVPYSLRRPDRGAIVKRRNPWHGLIPFFIPLRRLIEVKEEGLPSPEEWPSYTLPKWGRLGQIPAGWVQNVIESGAALLLVDGLDELPDSRRPAIWRNIRDLCRKYEKPLRFCLTSREFDTTGERADQWRPPDGTRQTTVNPLNREKIELLIDRWHDAAIEAEAEDSPLRERLADYPAELKRKLFEDAEYNRLRQLAETPFLCAVICLVNRAGGQLLPRKRAELYQLCCEALLRRRDEQRGITPASPYDSLTVEQLMTIHARLALEMMVSGPKDRDVPEEMEEEETYIIEAKIEDAVVWLPECVSRVPAEEIRRLAEENPEAFIEHLRTRHGLLRRPVEGRLDFHHRALQEYLAASAVFSFRRLEILINNAQDDQWREIIILTPGTRSAGVPGAEQLIEELLDRGERDGLPICFALAVGCLETAPDEMDPDLKTKALSKLEEICPPRNFDEARSLRPAGSRIVSHLKYKKVEGDDTEIVVACARTLALVGCDEAVRELVENYGKDERAEVLAEVCRAPGVEPLHVSGVLKMVEKEKRIPDFALPTLIDLEPLTTLEGLEKLSIGGWGPTCPRLENLSHLARVSGLKELDLSFCDRVTDLSPLVNAKSLQSLNILCCRAITNLSLLSKELQILRIYLCPGVTDLSPLAEAPALERLEIVDCPGVTDLSPLAKAQALERLMIAGCSDVTDFSPLSKVRALECLVIGNCPDITDLGALAEAPKLCMLILYECPGLKNLGKAKWPAKLERLWIDEDQLAQLPRAVRDKAVGIKSYSDFVDARSEIEEALSSQKGEVKRMKDKG